MVHTIRSPLHISKCYPLGRDTSTQKREKWKHDYLYLLYYVPLLHLLGAIAAKLSSKMRPSRF